jgi:GDP-L-fucose synthase
MEKDAKIFVAGHRGLVGSSIVRNLNARGYSQILVRTRSELNLLNQAAINEFYLKEKPRYVLIAAARVGGINANRNHQADFLYENLMIASNLIHAGAQHGVEKLLFLGSSCIYPKLASQPMSETALLTGPLEETNEGYALAKIAGLKLCEMYQRQYQKRFISAMPTNLYGQRDNFDLENSHVIPGMMRRFHEAKLKNLKEVKVWGSGKPKREFLHVDDLAEALFVLMEKYEDYKTINVGTSEEVSVEELANLMKEIVGFKGSIAFDSSMPDGTPRKLLNSSRVNQLGWKPKIKLRDGLISTYRWAVEHQAF